MFKEIDARDGREWDALLRACTRNPAAHKNKFRNQKTSRKFEIVSGHIPGNGTYAEINVSRGHVENNVSFGRPR